MSLAKCLKKLKIDSSHEDSIISGLASLTEQGNLEGYRKATLALDQAMNDTLDEQEDIHIQLEKQGYSFKEDNSVKDSKLLEEKLNKQGYTFTITPKNVRDFVAKDKTREAQATTATNLASKFGKRITWIDAKGDFGINGVVVPNIKDVIFLDVNTKYPAHAVMGHELSHHLEYDKPDVYKDLVASMEGLLKNHKEYADKYKIEGASHKDIVKEMIGDIMGDNFTKQDFWNKLADQDRSLFTKIADTIKAWLEQFIKSNNLGSDAFVKDVKKAREVIALAVAKYKDVQQPTQSVEAKFHKVWHGSPHDHNKFDSAKIGTGEGAQAYGYGHYFAESKDVAEFYKKTLSNDDNYTTSDGTVWSPNTLKNLNARVKVRDALRKNTDLTKPIAQVQEMLDRNESEKMREMLRIDLSNLHDIQERGGLKNTLGKLYEVELAPEQDEYLLWDKPLSEQSDKVKNIIESTDEYKEAKRKDKKYVSQGYESIDNRNGEYFYKYVFGNVGEGHKDTSEYLHSLGIRGIKYLDGSSRSKGEGAYNYVIFDDNDVSITAKFSKVATENTLIAQHNLTVKNLLHSDRMGGLAAPSIAITDKTFPLKGFGEITLLADKDLVDPKQGAKAYGSDIYSPRYPQLSYDFSGKAIERLNTLLSEGIEKTGDREFYNDSLENDPFRELTHSSAAMYQFLKEQGVDPKLAFTKPKELPNESFRPFADSNMDSFDLSKDDKFREAVKEHFAQISDREEINDDAVSNLARSYANDVISYRDAKKNVGKVDRQATNSKLFHQITDSNLRNKFDNYLADLINKSNPKERIFQGYTNSGNRRYIPHDIDNVIKILKKDLRGGENFKYGLGSVRAKYSPQFKSIEQIRSSKDRLISSDAFKEVQAEVQASLDDLDKSLESYGTFSGFDNVESMLSDSAKMGISAALKYNGFENVPDSIKIDIQEFINKLKSMPTEYFEVKVLRSVGLGEFSAAIIPKGAPKEVKEILTKNGITDIREYENGNNQDRIEKINQVDKVMFSRVAPQDSEYLDAVNSGDMEKAQKLVNDKLAIIGAYWHGTPSGDLRGGMTGLHVGTKQAAMEALEARIGIPADGRGWDGTREYGKTLLAGRDRVASGQFGKYRDSGYNMDSPKDDFYAEDHELPTVGNDVKVDPSWKPWIRPVLIVGDMVKRKKTDSAANSLMYKLLSQGKATSGFYYENDGEDTGSVSAVLPNGDHVKIKLPDAVTYDDEGNVIPLSERFNKDNNDIRFSRAKTVTVDGIERPTTNSEGKQINNPVNFWKWFGDSKVVDEEGRPYVFGGFYLKNNKKPSIPKKYKEALLAGERLRQKHKDIGVYRDMSVHEMRKDDSFDGDKLEQIMFELGWRGYSLDELPATVAFRIGDIPKTLISKDFASGVIEYGVSVVDELTHDNQNTESFYDLMLSQRGTRQYVAGFRNPYYDGADGEPLLLFPIKIDGGLGAIKSSLGNSGEFSSSSDDIRFSKVAPQDTIKINGVDRPTTNSEGKAIHPTQEGISNFWKWFGDSKVVDKKGRPLVVYHGGSFDENDQGVFDTTGKAKKTMSLSFGTHFAEDRSLADQYKDQIKKNKGRVTEAYLAVRNPLVLNAETDANGDTIYQPILAAAYTAMPEKLRKAYDRIYKKITKNYAEGFGYEIWLENALDKLPPSEAKAAVLAMGYDGVVYTAKMRGAGDAYSRPYPAYIALQPNQIKSAIGNNGEYSSANNDIRFSKAATPPEETTYQKSQRTVQDKFNRFSVIRDWLKERGVKLTELSNVYDAEERYHAKVANQLEDFREKIRNPLIEKIAKAGFTLSDVQDFLLAQHASEANKQIQKVRNDSEALAYGVTDKEASEYLSKAKPELATLANELRDVTEQAKQLRLDAGILNKDITDNWDNTYKHYIPVKGDESIQGTGKGLNVKHKDKRRLGHEKRNEAVIENILMDYERAIMEVEKNRVGKYLVMFAAEANNPDLITVGKPEKRNILKENNSYAIVDSDGVIHSVYVNKVDAQRNAPPGSSIQKISDPRVIAQASPMLAPNEVNVYMDGHAIRVQLNDDLLARAYANMGVESVGAIVEAGRVLNSYLSKVYTGYNPEFIVTNIIRDFTSGIVNLTGEEGTLMAVKAIGNYPKMFADLFRYAVTRKSTELIDSYRANGGNTGAAYLSDMERLGKEISSEYASYQGVIANIKAGDGANAFRAAGRKVFNSTLKWIEHLNQAGENAMRLSAYKAMLDSGKTVEQASKVAKNITVNFNRRGEIGQTANALYLFFNASVQGSAAVLHANLRGNHKYQANALAVGMASLGYMLAAGLGGMDEEEYDKIDDTTKERNLIIGSGDSYVKIPIPYGYGFFFNTGRVIADAQRKGEFGKAPFRMAVNAVEELTPFGNLVNSDEINSEQVVGGVAPTALQIPYQMSTNTSLFTGKEIRPVSPFDSSQPEREQMFRNTKGTVYDDMAGLLSNAGFDVSPENIKFLTRTLTGGTGALVDTAVSSSKLKAQGVELDIKEMPFIRKFIGENTISNDRSAYYKAVEEATKAAEEFSRARKNNDISSMKKIMEDKRELLAMDKYANKLRKVIKLSRDMQDSVRLNEEIPIAEKRLKLKELEAQESKLYDKYLDVYKARVK